MKPPEVIAAGEVVLKRWESRWTEEATTAVRESLPELRAFLPWAGDDYGVETAREFVEHSDAGWVEGTAFHYAIFDAADELIGSISLMTRMGSGVLEVGYWLRTTHTGRGHMTAAVEALVPVALTLPGVERVALRHDAANVRSAAVADRAGFAVVDRLDTTVIRERRRISSPPA